MWSYRWILFKYKISLALFRLSKRLCPAGHCKGLYRQPGALIFVKQMNTSELEDLRKEIRAILFNKELK